MKKVVITIIMVAGIGYLLSILFFQWLFLDHVYTNSNSTVFETYEEFVENEFPQLNNKERTYREAEMINTAFVYDGKRKYAGCLEEDGYIRRIYTSKSFAHTKDGCEKYGGVIIHFYPNLVYPLEVLKELIFPQ